MVRRNWRTELAARGRYQQAMHFVTHEMRTPLSAIQGSSELISRFPLTEEKRKQIALLINSESKRLARMVEIFLNVERLSAGQMELKREPIAVKEMVEQCVERARPLAERKRIAMVLAPIAGRPADHRRPRTDGVRLLQFTHERSEILSSADRSVGLRVEGERP